MLKLCYILSLINAIECGMEGLVVGGDFGDIQDYPHVAYLAIDRVEATGNRDYYTCGSSILNQVILLTAAHCLAQCSMSSEITARVGHTSNSKGSKSSVLTFVIHKDYDSEELTSDIGLVRLKTKLKLSRRVRRVAVMKNPPYYEPAQLAGWGLVDEINHKFDDRLKYVYQKVWDVEECRKILTDKPNGTICASGYHKKDYASSGDSGSALLVRGYIQIGLVSYKQPFISRQLIVYTDVGHYYNWIKTNSKLLYCRRYKKN